MRKKFFAALAMALLFVVSGCTPAPIVNIPSAAVSAGAAPLVVAIPQVPDGTVPAEGTLLANVYAAALNAAGVDAKVSPSPVANGGLASGLEDHAFDIVPVFSRLALKDLSGKNAKPDPRSLDAGAVVAALKESLPAGVLQLDPTKVDDHSNLVVTAMTAEKHQLKSIADAAKVCDQMTLGATADFKIGSPGLTGLETEYKCTPKAYESLKPSLDPGSNSIFWNLLQDKVQLAVMPSTSPAIDDNSLVVLNDPQQLFRSQTVVPLVLDETVDSAVQDVLNKVSAVLNTEELANLNRLSQDRHYADVAEVAKAWLNQKGLIKTAP